jgi:hypothetical protein
MLQRSEVNSLIDFIEAYHTAMGEFPGRSQIMTAAVTASARSVNPEELDEFLDDESTLKSLDERGIIPPWVLHNNPTGLTPEQIAVAAALNNTKDRRADSRKLTHLGISERKFSGWMHNKAFVEYMRVSANNVMENAEYEAHMALLRKVSAGDTNAVKLYFEMTGRYNPANESTVNLQQVLVQIIEVIQRRVIDPETRAEIASDLKMIAVQHQMTNGNNKRAIEPTQRREIDSGDEKFSKNTGALFF